MEGTCRCKAKEDIWKFSLYRREFTENNKFNQSCSNGAHGGDKVN